MGAEKRRRSRSACHLEAELEVAGASWKGPCRDISLNGLFLSGAGGPATGSACLVKITLSGARPRIALTISGRVVRSGKDGTAVSFEAMDAETFSHLRSIVTLHSSDPDRVLRELGD